MKRILITLLFATACTPSGDGGVRDTDVVVDTDVRDDTFKRDPGDTDTQSGDSDSGLLDSDSGAGPIDTAACKLGFREDCNGRCFPDHFLGDGHCDDGGALPADFDCDQWNHDGGDCVVADTDTNACAGRDVTIEFRTVAWPTEIGWHIDAISGAAVTQPNVYKLNFGSYGAAPAVYTTGVYLTPGSYQFVGQDSYGDGWHGATFNIIDDTTGQVLASGGPELSGLSYVWKFDVSCEAPESCTVDITTTTGDDHDEMGWQLYNRADRFINQQLPGQLSAGRSTVSLDLIKGPYNLRMRDVAGDGWEGGKVEVRYRSGLLMAARGLGVGSDGVLPFTVDCGLPATQPALDAPPPPFVLSTCARAKTDLTTRGATYAEIGWSLWKVEDWSRVAGRAFGGYTASGSTSDTFDLQSGLYYWQAEDRNRDGWNGARLDLVAPNGATLDTLLLPDGSNLGRYLNVVCPGPDVGDTDTDVQPPDCLPGATRDCDGVCFPISMKGDGRCDDGGQYAANFACETHAFDGGDCTAP